jgi:[acyl-carrier-protein] S-malonyltransferase
MKLAFVFPGQGSQSVGMMQGWGDRAEVRATFAEASDALGLDLWALVSDGPADLLNQTVNTQPAMLAADVAAWRTWQAAGGATPALLAGHSLGEYAALVAAGSLSFSDAIKLVRFRAEAMQAAVPEGVGAMAAILGLDDDAVRAVCSEAAVGGGIDWQPLDRDPIGRDVTGGEDGTPLGLRSLGGSRRGQRRPGRAGSRSR